MNRKGEKRRPSQAAWSKPRETLRAFTSETTSELDVLGLNRDTLGVDSGQVGVLEQGDEVRLGGLLQRTDRRRLEAKIGFEVLRDLTHKTLERQLADQELGRLLVTTDLTKSDRSGLVL
ncbi:BQ5605_C023g09661 [Microbotryum silenes-dioicae]|uniref:BQ5605_C023g09661 protein n=1 Tax=Microbotryum silenes-dioicae TaxID=796604 RepID=A0A2X0MQ02_9BASI|nr:BQ5605_C023g09661 [Microbotryum silenes-dioicae]